MYKLIGTNSVKRLADGAYIPFAEGNMDYEEYKQWLLDGNTPEPEFTEKEIEAQRIQAIKAKAAELITLKYPDYKQLNIIRVGGAELETMSAYIDSIREISNQAEQDVIKVDDVQWL